MLCRHIEQNNSSEDCRRQYKFIQMQVITKEEKETARAMDIGHILNNWWETLGALT